MPDLMIEARHLREQDVIRLEPDTDTRAGLWGWVARVQVDGDVVHLLLDDVFTPLDLRAGVIVEVERDDADADGEVRFYGACGVPNCERCLPRFDLDNNPIGEVS